MEQTKEKNVVNEVPEKILKAKAYNRKMFPIYKMFSWDLLFFYSISFLFFTQVKGLSASDVLILDASYTIFKFVFQIPCVNLADLVGKRKGLIIGNLMLITCILIIIFSSEMLHIVIAYAFMGFGYSLNGLCESAFLSDCITTKIHPGTQFSSIDGRGSSYWYILDGITAISCGFLYVLNNYLPMFLCLACCIISCIIAYKFKPYEDSHHKEKLAENGSYIQYFKDLRVAFRNIFKSRRLKALFLFSGMFAALLALRSTVASSLFTEIGIKEEYFGVIFAVLTWFSAISSNFPNFYHRTLRNKLLTYFSLIFSFSLIGIGVVALFSTNFTFTIIIVLILYSMQYIIKGPYYTLKKRYLNSFSTPIISTKIYSVNTLVDSLISAVICFIASLLLGVTSTAYTVLFIGCVFTLMFIFILDYMKDKIRSKT